MKPRNRATSSLAAVIAAAIVALAGGACSDDSDDSERAATETTRPEGRDDGADGATDVTPTPQPSAAAALEMLLAAEQRGDYDASFAFVQRDADAPSPTLAEWTRARRDLPAITGFSVESPEDSAAVATVTHDPGLDPFRGLVPGTEQQTWTAARADGGWLLVQEPVIEPVLPPESDIEPVARDWAAAVQRCAAGEARELQAVPVLYGGVTENVGLCGSTGAIATAAPGPLASGALSSDIVTQYSADALDWGRVVPIAEPVELFVVLAPIGDVWRVLGVGRDA